MTSHELGKKLLEGPDLPVAYKNWDDFVSDPLSVEVREAEECVWKYLDFSGNGEVKNGPHIYLS